MKNLGWPFGHNALDKLGDRANRAARGRAIVPLGSITEGSPILSTGTHTFSNSYPAGGETPTLPPSVDRTDVVFYSPNPDYALVWNEGTGKVEAYDGATEVTATTDLSALVGVRYIVIEAAPSERVAVANEGESVLERVSIVFGAAVASSLTNYWTLTLWERNGITTELRATMSMKGRSFAAFTDFTIWEPLGGWKFASGSRLTVKAEGTGNPPPLAGASLEALFSRKVG